MNRTPQYRMPFFQGGDLYSASLDLDRMTVIDNQLDDLSSIVGDGVLTGWNVCHSGVDQIQVSPGVGFINGIINKTLSIRKATVQDNVSTNVYMQSRMMTSSGGLNLETESPASNLVSAIFADTTPPAQPTGLVASAVDFNLINLAWDPNTEPDLDHYLVQRSLNVGGPFVTIASPVVNGSFPSDPFQDGNLVALTAYFYQIIAVDHSGNMSTPSVVATATTLPDIRKPVEVSGLQLFPGNTMMSVVWNQVSTPGATYVLTQQGINLDGSIASTTVLPATTALYAQLTGLTNNMRYRITLQSKTVAGVLSNGTVAESTPVSSAAPLDVLVNPLTSTTPQINAVALTWTANPAVPTGTGIGLKQQYQIRVIANGVASAPITGLGLILAKTVVSYNQTAAIGIGQTVLLAENTTYLFRITTLDAVGNESAGAYLKATTPIVTPPKDPRNLVLTASTGEIKAVWNHSSSTDVAGYNIAIAAGAGPFGADIQLGYVLTYDFTGLTNGVQYKVRVRARDIATPVANLSPGAIGVALPAADIVPPAVPANLQATSEDGQVSLTWTPNGEPDFSFYVLQRQAISQTLGAVPGKNFTVVTEFSAVLVLGAVTGTISSGAFTSNDLVGLADFTGAVVIMGSGAANGQKGTITSSNINTGTITFSPPFTQVPQPGDSFTIHLTDPSLGTSLRNVGTTTSILDVQLVNGQAYAYSLQAVDLSGNASVFSAPVIVVPDCGLNDLNPPTNLVAAAAPNTITLTWDQIVPDASHPAFNHTAFNVYRSTSPFAGFVLIDSVSPTVLTFIDSNLVSGLTYFYIVTAVRDNAEVVLDTGAIQPSNTVQLAVVKINTLTPLGCNIAAIQNVQRIVANLEATVSDETLALLLTHRHSVKPLNSITFTATNFLAMTDVSQLVNIDFTTFSHSTQTQLFYQNLVYVPGTVAGGKGTAIKYDPDTTYVISPSNVVNNLPFAGDFQILVNGAKPTVPFSIDFARNTVTFPERLKDSDVVALDGTGFSYYVPTALDLGNVGYDIFVDGTENLVASVDEGLQTVRFQVPLASSNVVTVTVEPLVPDFGTQQGARQVSLNPSIVLSDFASVNQTVYVSTSGAFDSTDTVFALVNGVRSTNPHVVDASAKTITFDTPLDPADVVALQILNREEVQGLLPASRVGTLDGSQLRSGILLKAQLPPISHEGRINEPALPAFQTLTTTDSFSYAAGAGILGTATTPYSLFQFDDGSLLLGSSTGLLQATGFQAFNNSGGSSQTVIDYTLNPPSGLAFTPVKADQIVNAAKAAVPFSGRIDGSLPVIVNQGGQPFQQTQLIGPNIVLLDNGTYLITGGNVLVESVGRNLDLSGAYIYDPMTGFMTFIGHMSQARSYHASAFLSNGLVLITGGSTTAYTQFDVITGEVLVIDTNRYMTAELFDPSTNTFFPARNMNESRDRHTMTVINDNEVLIVGGNSGTSEANFIFNPPKSFPPVTLTTCELYNVGTGSFTETGQLNRARAGHSAKFDGGVVIVSGGGQPGGEIYQRADETWTLQGAQQEVVQNAIANEYGPDSIDGTVKQIFIDSFGLVYLVTRNNVYTTTDGQRFVKMSGLEAVGVVHVVSQAADGTMFAGTDLGVYEITTDIRSQATWFQGGIINFGTTETFDLQPYGSAMLAGTEIGIYQSVDAGNTWTPVDPNIQDVYNIELIGNILFANAGQDLYRSDDGITWTKVATLPFLDPNSTMVARDPLDIFFATAKGLFASRDGVTFFLVDFDKNRHPLENNVHMAVLIGGDVYVGYDNLLVAIGPNLEMLPIAEFTGIVPTVRVNGSEFRTGFRYDLNHNQVVFEQKRLVGTVVSATSNYAIYSLVGGPWYSQRADAAVIVHVNGVVQDDSTLALDPRLGQVSFNTSLTKIDVVTVSVSDTSLLDPGDFYHSELEDKFDMQKGLPLSLGRDYVGNLLQMGISIEHNFQERGIERNQYYCLTGCEVDRSFNSFLQNAQFFIMGRQDFDRFNSTIDYNTESQQPNIGTSSLVPLSVLEVSSMVWVGTEDGIFVLDPSASFAISNTISVGQPENPIRDMQFFGGDVYAVSGQGLFFTADGGNTFTRNPGEGLPASLYVMSSLNNIILLGTDDAIYYSDDSNDTPAYAVWFRANFTAADGVTAIPVTGTCQAMAVSNGVAFAAIDNSIYLSVDGKVWSLIYTFTDKTIRVHKIAMFARMVFLGTNKGVYTDDGSARSSSVSFRLELTDSTKAKSAAFSINDMFVSSNGVSQFLYVVGNRQGIYELASETWNAPVLISNISTIHKFIITSASRQVAISNNLIFVQ